MESYTFSSQLTYEHLSQRIKLLARPHKLFSYAPPETYLYEFYGENGFCLIRTPHSCNRDMVMFRGRLIRTPAGTNIVGKFSISPLYARCIWLFYLIPMLFLLIYNLLFFSLQPLPFWGRYILYFTLFAPVCFQKTEKNYSPLSAEVCSLELPYGGTWARGGLKPCSLKMKKPAPADRILLLLRRCAMNTAVWVAIALALGVAIYSANNKSNKQTQLWRKPCKGAKT